MWILLQLKNINLYTQNKTLGKEREVCVIPLASGPQPGCRSACYENSGGGHLGERSLGGVSLGWWAPFCSLICCWWCGGVSARSHWLVHFFKCVSFSSRVKWWKIKWCFSFVSLSLFFFCFALFLMIEQHIHSRKCGNSRKSTEEKGSNLELPVTFPVFSQTVLGSGQPSSWKLVKNSPLWFLADGSSPLGPGQLCPELGAGLLSWSPGHVF